MFSILFAIATGMQLWTLKAAVKKGITAREVLYVRRLNPKIFKNIDEYNNIEDNQVSVRHVTSKMKFFAELPSHKPRKTLPQEGAICILLYELNRILKHCMIVFILCVFVCLFCL